MLTKIEELLEQSDRTEDGAERIKLLSHAKKLLEDEKTDEREDFTYSVSFRLACAYFMQGKYQEARFECEASLIYAKLIGDAEDIDSLNVLYYRILIELEDWKKILALTMNDETHGLAWGYSRLIAAWMMTDGKNRALCASMFWDALILSPDVPFYMLGYYEEPEDEDEHSDFEFALMYMDAVGISEELQRWFTRGVILFGLLTNRFDGLEREYMLDVLDSLGGYEEYEKMSGMLIEGDDQAVIEALAANKCLSN